MFARPDRATRLIEIVQKHSTAYRFAIHAYCVMPDHFHLLVTGLRPESDLLAFVKNVKQTSSAEFARDSNGVVWQKKFYDHILRQGEPCDAVAGYIWMNPVRAGLCVDPRDYPHSGSFTTDWKNIVRPLESWVPEWKNKK